MVYLFTPIFLFQAGSSRGGAIGVYMFSNKDEGRHCRRFRCYDLINHKHPRHMVTISRNRGTPAQARRFGGWPCKHLQSRP
ncbi:hypothetical protein LI328DRAFT_136690 [Trichoderma asperelloides]|nr:hypothetical protein LI328DRAFT_136690 [Trichoderma asperelloides]